MLDRRLLSILVCPADRGPLLSIGDVLYNPRLRKAYRIEDGIPVLVSLHVLDLAMRHSDRIVGLKHGEVMVAAPTTELTADDLAVVYQHEEDEDVDGLA